MHDSPGSNVSIFPLLVQSLGRDEINALFAFQILKNALFGVLGIKVGILSAKNLKKIAQHS